jgi:stress-induced morphogen
VLYTAPEKDLAVTPDEIRTRIRAALPDADITVRDTTGGGDHFDATVVSSAFAGKGPVERHRLVYAALNDAIIGSAAPIHALALTTATPEEYQRK